MGGWGLVTGSLELRIQSWPTGASTTEGVHFYSNSKTEIAWEKREWWS